MSFFSSLLKSIGTALGVVTPKAKIEKAGPVPTRDDAAVQMAAADQLRRARTATGRSNAILSLDQEVLDPKNVVKPQILGF
jgi:hypothetical protein